MSNFLVPCQFEIERFQQSGYPSLNFRKKYPSACKALKFTTWSSYIESDAVWFHSGLNEPIMGRPSIWLCLRQAIELKPIFLTEVSSVPYDFIEVSTSKQTCLQNFECKSTQGDQAVNQRHQKIVYTVVAKLLWIERLFSTMIEISKKVKSFL